MKKLNNNFLKIFYIVLIISNFCACTNAIQHNPTLTIVCTTGMIKDAIENIVQNKAHVTALMQSGVDPHLYKATQGDVILLLNSDIVFYNGLHLEGKMGEILEKLSLQKPTVAVSENIPRNQLLTLQEPANNKTALYDPHIWFDVTLWIQAVKKINETLKQIDTINAQFYQQNADAYIQQLKKAHQQILSEISTIPTQQRILITSHDAFRYFGKQYNIEVLGLQGISTVSEFGLQDVTKMVNLIVQRNIKAIFIESSVPVKPIEAIVEGCKAKNHQVQIGGSLYSDAMGSAGTYEGTYIGMILHNSNIISQKLKGD